jgi:signal transduction histidine kinase/CheY-like chemotaxis protein
MLALIVEALMLFLLITNSLRLLRDNMGEQAKLQAEQIAPVIGAALVAPLAQSDYATVQAVLDDSHAVRGIEYLAVMDKQGHIVAISGWPIDKPLPDTSRGFVLDESGVAPRYDLKKPVLLAGQQLGMLHFGVDLSKIIEARRALLSQGVVIAFGELMLSAALLTLLGMLITRQLSVLTRASNAVADGDVTPLAVPEGDDDVGRLGIAFNKMSQAVAERVSLLTQARDEMAHLASSNEHERARITALVGAMKFGVLFSDPENRLVYMNRTMDRLWEINTGDMVPGEYLEKILPNMLSKIQSADTRLHDLLSGSVSVAEIALHSGRLLHLQRLPVTNASGEVLGLLWLSSDVTEERMAARQLIAAKDAADAANAAKSNFLANMSHEIRTPMNGVIGMLDLALDTSLNAEQRDFLGIARSSAEGLLTIINDILDFSKIEAGKLDVEGVDFDVRSLMADVASFARISADKKRLPLIEETLDDLPRFINGDPVRIRQVAVNLIGNAIKFTEQGQIRLKAWADQPSATGRRWHFSVSDSGIGIPPDKQQQIFDAFAQQDVSTTRRYGGTGLGLTISSRLVQLMGGTIGVESEPGRGSTFHVSLPLTVGAESPSDAPQLPQQVESVANLRILVVEDNAVNQKVMLSLLERLGHIAVLAANGREAVDSWAGGSFDLILMDIQMPVMGGIEATTLIRQAEKERQVEHPVPIYALSAAAMVTEQQQAIEAGLDGYLTKPLDRKALIKVLGQVSLTSREQQAPQATGS